MSRQSSDRLRSKQGRANRVATRAKEVLSSLFLSGKVKDPRLDKLVVTRVWLSEDLQIARVYVRSFGGVQPDDEGEHEMLPILARAAGRLQSMLGAQLSLRRAPKLQFYWDHELDQVRHIDEVLERLATEREVESAVPSSSSERPSSEHIAAIQSCAGDGESRS